MEVENMIDSGDALALLLDSINCIYNLSPIDSKLVDKMVNDWYKCVKDYENA